MSDTFGGITIPVATTTPAGDPTIGKIASFLQAAINADCGAAFDAMKVTAEMATEFPVVTTLTVDPRRYAFEDGDLPALFVWREEDKHDWTDADVRADTCTVNVTYMFPHDPYSQVVGRMPFANAIAKCVDNAITNGVHPAWLDTGDTTPYAATITEDLDSIKAAIATSLAPQTYAAGDLNGVVGAATMNPRREPTITTTASAGTYVGPAVLTYVNWHDETKTASFALNANGGQTLRLGVDVKSVTSWALPAQSNVNGTFTFGTSASASSGRGSFLRARAGLQEIELMSSRREQVNVEVLGGDDNDRLVPRKYDVVEMKVRIVEELLADVASTTGVYPINTAPHGLDLDVTQGGFTTSASLPN